MTFVVVAIVIVNACCLSFLQVKGVYQKKNTKITSNVSVGVSLSSTQEDVKPKLAEALSTIKMEELNDTIAAVTLDKEPAEHCMSNSIREHVMTDATLSMQDSANSVEFPSSPNKGFSIISIMS